MGWHRDCYSFVLGFWSFESCIALAILTEEKKRRQASGDIANGTPS
jgi:hypothetical protein